MDYIQFALGSLIVLFIYIVVTKVFMKIAAYIGEQAGFSNFFIGLFRKVKKLVFKWFILLEVILSKLLWRRTYFYLDLYLKSLLRLETN